MGADRARAMIQASLDRSSQATLSENIDAYMDELPPDFHVVDESGEIITREIQRQNVLRDWSVIEKTLRIEQSVKSIDLRDEIATVTTSQLWERIMRRPDRSGTDIILTTQRHRETWRYVNGRWYGYEIIELGGEIFVNGKRYLPDGT